jgi:predicted HTH domain antitoxin
MNLAIPDDLAASAGLTEAEARAELAVSLYRSERLTLAQAARFAAVDRVAFYRLLARYGVPINYEFSDFEQDLDSLRSLGRL